VCYDTRQARPAASAAGGVLRKSVGFCIVDGQARPVCLWPICRRTGRPTAPRHILHVLQPPSREETHTAVHAPCTCNTRLRVVVKVSHLLAAAGPCTRRRCMRVPSSFQLFEVYYVFGGARARARSVQGAPPLSRV